MTLLVTGGAGFIGSNLAKTLLAQGHHVIVVDNFITSSPDNIEDLFDYPNFEFYKLDINYPAFSHLFFKKDIRLDAIYHLACPTGVPNCIALAEEMLDTCSVGTKRVLELARDMRAPIVVSSTAEVYGDPQVFPQTENYNGNVSTTGQRSAYEEGKRFTESMVAMFVRKYSLNARIARLFNAYGPKMSLDDTRVQPRLIGAAVHNRPLIVHGDGSQTRTFCYVDDTVKGLMTIMHKGRPAEIYNLGSDRQISIRQLAQKIIKLTGSSSTIAYRPHPLNNDHQDRLPSVAKLTKLGWRRQVELDQGLIKMIGFWQSLPAAKFQASAARRPFYSLRQKLVNHLRGLSFLPD